MNKNALQRLMEKKRLLYVADLTAPNFNEVLWLLKDLQKLGLEETVFLLPGEMTDWEKRLNNQALRCKIYAKKNVSVLEILRVSREEDISIIAAYEEGKAPGLMGHTFIRDLIRSSPIPVIVIPKNAPLMQSQERGIFDHPIFATDWSPESEKSLNHILSLKKSIKELELITVITSRLSVRDMRNLKKRLQETRERLLDGGIDAEAHIYAGKPAHEIMLAARDYDATSIVMGSTRKSFIKNIFSPSCSYGVAEGSAVPTMIVT